MPYSIWVIPEEEIAKKLQKIIDELAEKYHAPVFVPHITILSGINKTLSETENAIRVAVAKINCLPLSLGPVSFSTTYYQSVFVRVNSTAQLMQLNLDLKKLLELENSLFMPHISLLYGSHDMKTREKIASKVKLVSVSFLAQKIVVIPENPEPQKWKPAATVYLNK